MDMGFFQRLFGSGRKRSEKPAVLRFVSASRWGTHQDVHVVATWFPSGEQTRRTLLAEAGLCILPWRAGQKRVRIEARIEGDVGQVELSTKDCASDLAHEVGMVPG